MKRWAVPAVAVLFFRPAVAVGAEPLRVKASPVMSACVEAVAVAYRSATGRAVVVDTVMVEAPDAGRGYDVVVGADEELTRVLEGGSAHPDHDIDVARVPWVLLGATPGTQAVEALATSNAKVRVVDGPVGLEARSWLRRTGRAAVSGGVARGGPVRLDVGEMALVPASIAGPSEGVAVDVPPVVVRAVGMRTSRQLSAVADFLAFLEKGPGKAAFCACGRAEAR
jgi:hypothetical protein